MSVIKPAAFRHPTWVAISIERHGFTPPHHWDAAQMLMPAVVRPRRQSQFLRIETAFCVVHAYWLQTVLHRMTAR